MSLTFFKPRESHAITLHFTAHEEQYYPYFSYICTIKMLKNIVNLTLLKLFLTPFNLLFLLLSKLLKMKSYFLQLLTHISTIALTLHFLQALQNTKPELNICSVIIRNVNHHSAILSQGYFGYIEISANNIEQPPIKNIKLVMLTL